ncbi:MAG: hypothetical protein RLZZ267_1230 [Bacillota bacterium]
MARSRGIEPRSQAPEAYVISIGPRAHTGKESILDFIETDLKKQGKQWRMQSPKFY